MARKPGIKTAKVTVTVGDLIAAVFDQTGNRLDQAIELLRCDEMRRRTSIVIEGEPSKAGLPRPRRSA